MVVFYHANYRINNLYFIENQMQAVCETTSSSHRDVDAENFLQDKWLAHSLRQNSSYTNGLNSINYMI